MYENPDSSPVVARENGGGRAALVPSSGTRSPATQIHVALLTLMYSVCKQCTSDTTHTCDSIINIITPSYKRRKERPNKSPVNLPLEARTRRYETVFLLWRKTRVPKLMKVTGVNLHTEGPNISK